MTHRRTNKAHKRQQQQQHGGMKFGHALKRFLMSRDIPLTPHNAIGLLMSLVDDSRVRIVWDASAYSFIFELTFAPDYTLLDPFGIPLAQSVDTLDAHNAAAAGAPEHGTPVSNFCVKLSFVHPDGSGRLKRQYNRVQKQTVSAVNANREADTQRMLFEAFACRSTTAPFVSDVIGHVILSGPEFQNIFKKALSSIVASTTPGVSGTPKGIYDWIIKWIESDQIKVDVLAMQMLDYELAMPGVPRSMRFNMIHLLKGTPSYDVAALRMAAEIAAVCGKEIVPHDFHGGNGMAIPNGSQVCIVDLGGIFNLAIREDRAKVLSDFEKMCGRSKTTAKEESDHALEAAKNTSDTTQKLRARFPCLQDLCGFFEIDFKNPPFPNARDENIKKLREKFEEELNTGFVDFMCVAPTPKNVHHTLALAACIDFMYNKMNHDHPYCQCGDVLEIVYPRQVVTFKSTTEIDVTTFRDFRTFLRTFEVNTLPPNTELDKVVGFIEKIVAPCPSACAAISPQMLRPTSWMESERKRIMLEAHKRRLAEEAEERREEIRRLAEKTKEAKRRKLAEAEEAEAAEERRRLAEEAEEAEERRRLAEEAEAEAAEERRRLAEEAEERRRLAEEAEERRRLAEADTRRRPSTSSSNAKRPTSSKAKRPISSTTAKATAKASKPDGISKPETNSKPAQIAQQAAQQAKQPPSAAPMSWFNPLSWFKKKGGTRKRRRHN